MTAPRARSVAPGEPPAQPVARFHAALTRLWPEGGKLGLAVSGGTDSLAMMLLAHAAIPEQFEVACVDHGLRTASADECTLVAALCAERAIACRVIAVTVAPGNVQAEARRARYDALCAWARERGLGALATAHHADDQAETLLMRLNRGSGVAGLAGVRERSLVGAEGGETVLLRPVLAFRRAELAAVLAACAVEPAHDPSNADVRFDRVRLRRALAEADWLDPAALARSAAHLAEAEAALEAFTDESWARLVRREGDNLAFDPTAPRIIRLRVIERIIRELGGGDPRGGDVARLLDILEAGSGGTLGGVLASGPGPTWVFRPEPPRRGG